MNHGPHRWRKSSYSSSGTNCVELAADLAHLRDSKNPTTQPLAGNVPALLAAVKADHLTR
ncbi:MAG TPA: DUF397 domain-containing protein [Pseudonocardiaceae bacterium]|nr:DUF397 domain-containing protein [Pseudonocardiaceae bacterium]